MRNQTHAYIMQKYIEFALTLGVNATLGILTGIKSDKYQTKLTPTGSTFGIWSYIYRKFTTIIFELDDELFIESMKLNRLWLYQFTMEDLTGAYKTIQKLKGVNIELAKKFDSNS